VGRGPVQFEGRDYVPGASLMQRGGVSDKRSRSGVWGNAPGGSTELDEVHKPLPSSDGVCYVSCALANQVSRDRLRWNADLLWAGLPYDIGDAGCRLDRPQSSLRCLSVPR